jgi:hypothetical protein
VRTSATSRQRVFLTFATGDLQRVRPITARLQAGGSLALDHALSSEPFASSRGEIIRASLLARLRHCTSALCLYGAETLDDAWVRWALERAVDLRLPLLGAAISGEEASASERFLVGLGAELVPLGGDAIASRARAVAVRRRITPIDATSIAETLALMRHPIR